MAAPQEWRLAVPGDAERVREAVASFGVELAPRMAGDGRNEDRLRAPVGGLLKALGGILGREVVVHDEVHVSEVSARPDFAVDAGSGRVGFVELKRQEKGIPSKEWRPDGHDREQWEKLKALPNLIYTNGSYWGLFRHGEQVGDVGVLEGDLRRAGGRLAPAGDGFERLFREFFAWVPEQPTSIRGIIAEVAPLCRLLRDQVAEVLSHEASSPGARLLTELSNEWRTLLFPQLNNAGFADSYAQTVTFAMLLARVDGISFDDRSLTDVAVKLAKQHSLMGEALALLTNHQWVDRLSVVATLARVVGNIVWDDLQLIEPKTYPLLHESFLASYDPKLRRKSGTYYTPEPVARAMVALTDQILRQRLGITRGFASDEVTTVDPAMGTGTFLVEIIDSVASTLRRELGSVPQSHLRELVAERIIGFECQAAPYAVAEVRVHDTMKRRYGVDIPPQEGRFLTDALQAPEGQLPLAQGQLYRAIQDHCKRADRVKRDQVVTVVIGNPPWRQQARGSARWLEGRRDQAYPPGRAERPSLDEFRHPDEARRAFNLSNMWTFYWRWATWKVYDAHPDHAVGIVALITPKAYLTSQSHAGMRRYLRENTDEGWIIDLSPEEFRPDNASRIFPTVQQPICIGIFARLHGEVSPTPARVRYLALAGRSEEKLDALATLTIDDERWQDAPTGWDAPFQPPFEGWDDKPRLGELFPWHQTGVTSNRNWVWSPDAETLGRRWSHLLAVTGQRQADLFKETSDRTVDRSYPPIPGVPSRHVPLRDEADSQPRVERVAFRSFDRQYLIRDRRVIDRPRPALWCSHSDSQIYLSEQHAHPISEGTPIVFSALVPDAHHLNGRGGRVIPLYRDHLARDPNIAPGLLEVLEGVVGPVTAEDLLAYVAGVAAHPGFTHRFDEALHSPGIRVPLTTSPALWQQAVAIGREVIWLHTYGERCFDLQAGRPCEPPRARPPTRPRLARAIPASDRAMPDHATYEPRTQTLTISASSLPREYGELEQVRPAVWAYTVGGVAVVRRWLNYRLCNQRHRRRTSPLDDINPARWTAKFDDELLELLQVIDRCVDLEPRQAELLEEICAAPLLSVTDLERHGVFPVQPGARKAPPTPATTLDLG